MSGVRGRTRVEARKLAAMIADLQTIKAELLPDEKDKQRAEDMKHFDDFQRKKHGLNVMLQDIRADVDRLNELRKKLGREERDTQTIRLQSDNTIRLKEAIELFNDVKKQLDKDAARTGRKKLEEKELNDRRHLVILLGEDIKDLTNQNARVKAIAGENETELAIRVEKRRQRETERREKRTEARKSRRHLRNDFDADELKEAQPYSEQEQAFEQKVAENMAEQDAMLQEIINGLDELKEIANEANKQLTVQKAMLEQVDDKIDSNIRQFKSANKRLQTILDESGGLSRWCPVLICLVVLLALIGYLFGVV